jgi:tRNA (adenine37-N6)-methyltransferase
MTGNNHEGPTFQLHPIGTVRQPHERDYRLEILPRYRPALKQLEHFSHVIAVWWAHEHDTPQSRAITTCEPPYAEGKVTGLFACRAEYRPNPVALTTCRILGVDEAAGIVHVAWIDAHDSTPLLDLKAYFPVADRVRAPRIPDWLSDWPEWMPEPEDYLQED